MISLDAILLLIFVTVDIMYKDWSGWGKIGLTNPSEFPLTLVFTVTTGYLLCHILFRLTQNKLFFTLQTIQFFLILITLIAYPLGTIIMLRHTSANYMLIHDGALQTEIASRFLFDGKNPYTQNYLKTPLEQWDYSEADRRGAKNPALYHYAYLPFYLLSSAAGHAVQKIGLGWEDIRITLFAEYLIYLFIVWAFIRNLKHRMLYFVLFSINPVILHFLLEGRNDIQAFLYLLLSAYFLQKKKSLFSALFLGCAMAFKQTLWLAAPFFLGYIWFKKDLHHARKKYFIIFLLTTAFWILPFLLWNAQGFIESTILYLSGGTAISYPISGIGFGRMLLSLGIIKDSHVYFPFWIFQLTSCLPLTLYFLLKLKKSPQLSSVFLFFGITSLIFFYFSRIFSDSYVVLILLSFLTSIVFSEKEKK